MTTIICLITCPSRDVALKLANSLVEEKLAACVNIVPGVESVYSWEGKVHHEQEPLLMVKTSGARREALEKRVMELHPYTTPEFVTLDISYMAPAYARWLGETLQ